MIDFIIHSNDVPWGHVWHIITTDGKGHIELQYDMCKNSDMFICSLSVTPDKRKQGIGTELLHIAENIAIENNKYEFRLTIDKPKKDWLYDFYIKQGYKVYSEDEDLIFFKKIIPGYE